MQHPNSTRPNKRSLDDKLEQLPAEESECSIYKVHRHLRDLSPKAYEPQLIAIGPYHRGKKHLQIMEHHKLLYLKSLLSRNGEESAGRYVAAIKQVESDARKCYAVDVNLRKIDFADMLVLDGCFIIELVRKYKSPDLRDDKDPIFQMSWIKDSLRRDLMLFENQVPFFVLCKLFDLIEIRDPHLSLTSLLVNFFEFLFPGGMVDTNFATNEMKHLLGLIHLSWTHGQNTHPDTELDNDHYTQQFSGSDPERKCSTSHRASHLRRLFLCHPSHPNTVRESVATVGRLFSSIVVKDKESDKDQCTQQVSGSDPEGDEEKILRFMKSASKLSEANVEFKKDESLTLFDIKFDKGVMRMAPLTVDDTTEAFLRNLIAYEQCFHDGQPTVVTDYVKFMDLLINSSKDVEILSHCGIIDNLLGNEEVVAKMVNKLTDSVTLSGYQFRYLDIFENVNKHCKNPWNRWMAMLRRNYLNSPWAVLSIIAAVILLLLTLTQTIFTIHPL